MRYKEGGEGSASHGVEVMQESFRSRMGRVG